MRNRRSGHHGQCERTGGGRRRALAAVAILSTSFLAPAGPARTQPAGGDAELAAQLGELVAATELASLVGIDVRDAASGRVVFQLHADTPMNPASNMKVATAAAALATLGAETRFHTGVYGRLLNGNVPDLVIEGHGDPSLEQSDLLGLAQALADRGVRTVDRIHVDADHFDDQILPPAFDQQPNETAYFRAAVGGLVVDESTFTLRVLPAAAVGERAAVRVRGASYFDLTGAVETVDGPPNVIAEQAAVRDGRMRLRVGGSVPPGGLPLTYRRRVENPVVYAGHLFADALATVGIRGGRAVSVGAVSSTLPLLADHESPSLAELLLEVGKDSDNFVAEMVLKQLGAARRTPGTSADGAAAVTAFLESIGVPRGAATVVNGSGLFRGNRIAPAHLGLVLTHAYRNPAIRDEFIAQLAIAGVDGTLENRLTDLPSPRLVRAKTGTLNDVISLSGYVLSADAGRAYTFSCIANGVSGKGAQARALFDAIARHLARRLAPRAG